ncbi:MAG: GNAT family N-acetyltransferase [Candidatus Heimdallarchaeota archaeon]
MTILEIPSRWDYKEFIISDMELNKENASKLADCLNSFDDSESWPGGFTHGNPFTAERVLDEFGREEAIARLVPSVDNQIVGICTIHVNFNDPTSFYVGLFGVNPKFQGRGFGKALLLCATELVTQLKGTHLDLHTWGGNLKAMPLYKRTGFNWFPETSVLMESYIPPILTSPFFSQFINKADWYIRLERPILQSPDIHKIDGSAVFKYHFKLDNDSDFLDIFVDREAKTVNGFHLQNPSLAVEIETSLLDQSGYIGSANNKFFWKLTNHSAERITIRGGLILSDGIKLVKSVLQDFNINLEPGDKKILDFDIAIGSDVKPTNKRWEVSERTSSTITSRFKIENYPEIALTSGFIIKEPFELSFDPLYPSVRSGKEFEKFGMVITNNMGSFQSLVVELAFEGGSIEPTEVQPIQLRPYESEKIMVTVYPDLNGLNRQNAKLILTLSSDQFVHPLRKVRELGVLIGGVSIRSLPDDEFLVENTRLQAKVRTSKWCGITHVIDLLRDESHTLQAGLDALGVPFPYATEDLTVHSYVAVRNAETGQLELSAESKKFPPLKVRKTMALLPGEPIIQLTHQIENDGVTDFSEVGFLTWGFGLWETGNEITIQTPDQVVVVDDIEWGGTNDLKGLSDRANEGWIFHNRRTGSFAVIWSPKSVYKIRLHRNRSFYLEYRFPLLANQTKQFAPIYLIFGLENWQEARRTWDRFYGNKNTPLKTSLEVDSQKAIGISICDCIDERKQKPLFLTRGTPQTLFLNYVNDFRRKLEGKVNFSGFSHLRVPDETILLTMTPESEGGMPVTVHSSDDPHLYHDQLEVSYQTNTSIRRYNTSIFYYGGSQEEKVHVTEVLDSHGNTVNILENGLIRLMATKKFSGSLHLLEIKGSPFNYIMTSYPDKKPYLWYNPFLGGLQVTLREKSQNHGEGMIYKFPAIKAQEINMADWKGIQFLLDLSRNNLLANIQASLSYLMLPSSNILRIDLDISNRRSSPVQLRCGYELFLSTEIDRVHFTSQDATVDIKVTENLENSFLLPRRAPWALFYSSSEGTIPYKLGFFGGISHLTWKDRIEIAEKTRVIFPGGEVVIAPGETWSCTCFLVFIEQLEEIQAYKRLQTFQNT